MSSPEGNAIDNGGGLLQPEGLLTSDWPAWPEGSEPERCPVFVHNERRIDAPPERVWRWLARADLWPSWFAGCTKLSIDEGPLALTVGSRVTWRMLGATIRVVVRRAEAPRDLDWRGGARGVNAYHAWRLEPDGDGTRIVTEETERGPLPWLLRWYLRGAIHRAHDAWLDALARVAESGGEPGTGSSPPSP